MKKLVNKSTYANKSGYSVIIALFMVGFLLILTTGILDLVLRELRDSRGRGSYLKAYYGAEAGQELALLKIKEKGYGYYDRIDHSISDISIVLSENPTDLSKFKASKDIFISYDLNSKINSYSGNLPALSYDIVPLFYLTGSTNPAIEKKVTDLNLTIISGNPDDLSWNIISNNSGISSFGSFNNATRGKGREISGTFIEKTVQDFLSNNNGNYIVLFNSNTSIGSELKYKITSSKEFSKPRTEISSSAQILNYKQNLETKFDHTDYLNILRYSIYSE